MRTATAPASLIRQIESTTEGISDYILGTTDCERTDRLWPSSHTVFTTNPLSLAYGACGTSLFLNNVLGEVPENVKCWLLAQPLDLRGYPPGLFAGLAGIAYTFSKMGLLEKAEEIMSMTYQSPLLYEESNVFLGAAGWGLASLYFYNRTEKQIYLDKAVQAGEHILKSAEPDGDTCYWRYNLAETVELGFGYGASGIALFLLYLGLSTGDPRFLSCAVKGLEYDLSYKSESVNGFGWGKRKDDPILYPYFVHGTSGVGSTVIRFFRHLRTDKYETLAHRIAEVGSMNWSVVPGLFGGISGIGEFMLDMFLFTGDEIYLDRARDIAETVLWFRVKRPEGLAFPGSSLSRISNSYGMGSAGIGLYLRRVLDPQPRLILDLD